MDRVKQNQGQSSLTAPEDEDKYYRTPDQRFANRQTGYGLMAMTE